jgi:Uma2 family endonuclease
VSLISLEAKLFAALGIDKLANMGLPSATRIYTAEEYLSLEQNAVDKHEFYRGEIFATSGGTEAHSLITTNVISAIHGALRGKPCRVYDSNLRIRIPKTTLFTYPDATVICGETTLDKNDPYGQTVINPTTIVEVLSRSTEAYDRGAKFENYQTIESLKEYVLISQNVVRVETFSRQSDETWLYSAVAGVDAVAHLNSIAIELSLRDIYDEVQLPKAGMDRQTD